MKHKTHLSHDLVAIGLYSPDGHFGHAFHFEVEQAQVEHTLSQRHTLRPSDIQHYGALAGVNTLAARHALARGLCPRHQSRSALATGRCRRFTTTTTRAWCAERACCLLYPDGRRLVGSGRQGARSAAWSGCGLAGYCGSTENTAWSGVVAADWERRSSRSSCLSGGRWTSWRGDGGQFDAVFVLVKIAPPELVGGVHAGELDHAVVALVAVQGNFVVGTIVCWNNVAV